MKLKIFGIILVFAVVTVTIWKFYPMLLHNKSQPVAILKSVITCPNCVHQKEETMPTDACQFFYECENCKKVIRPKEGDCCVYCSYGTVKCPSKQTGTDDCCVKK